VGFSEKQYDGPYEVSGVEININGEILKGVLYFPPDKFKKPYPLIIYFHGFPQLFSLKDIVKKEEFLLKMGYALLVCNFRGYQFSEGSISLKSHYNDAIKMIEFARGLDKKGITTLSDLNILAHDFGGYIALLTSARTDLLNKILLLSPLLDLKKHVYDEGFIKTLRYIKHFLPGNIRGIDSLDSFIDLTKEELSKEKFQIRKAVKDLKINKLKIIIGENDKLTPLKEVEKIFEKSNITPDIIKIKDMDHQTENTEQEKKIDSEIKDFF
jgi:pimeloyl-ACP methyl ester carboxylesterase